MTRKKIVTIAAFLATLPVSAMAQESMDVGATLMNPIVQTQVFAGVTLIFIVMAFSIINHMFKEMNNND